MQKKTWLKEIVTLGIFAVLFLAGYWNGVMGKMRVEEEAEAALLALGPKLQWTNVPDSVHGEEHMACREDATYTVVQYPASDPTVSSFEAYLVVPTVVFCEPLFQSAAAAKAACERHYATGRWE